MLRKMKGGTSYIVHSISYIISSAFFLILAYPDFNLTYLAWIALVPLLFAIDGRRPASAFRRAYAIGLLFFLGTIYWLIHVTLPGMVIVVAYLALYFGLFGVLAARMLRLKPLSALFAVPAAWVTCEWLRSTMLSGFGWNLLGYSQSPNPLFIQTADLFGAYGVGFLIAMTNTAVYLIARNFRDKKTLFNIVAASAAVMIACLAYGFVKLQGPFAGEKIRAGVIQGNIPQSEKWDASFREEILSAYETLSREASAARPDIVIWPETSVPGFMENERYLMDRVKSVARELHVPLLVGTPTEEKSAKGIYYNSAVLFSEDGAMVERYDKIHLVPFGEYVPFKEALSFVKRFAPSPIGDFSAGHEYKVFGFFTESSVRDRNVSWRMLKKAKCSVPICFEDIFPDLARRFVANGAAFLVNMTNDAWFGLTSAPFQHAQASAFRAVENRVWVVRAANTGLSCIMDDRGRITARVVADGRSIFVRGYVTGEVGLSRGRTFYNAFGDIFAYICILWMLKLCMWKSLQKKK